MYGQVNDLKDLFKSKHAETKLVFISSCCSEWSGQAFVDAGVPHVVAVKAGDDVEGEISVYTRASGNLLSFYPGRPCSH